MRALLPLLICLCLTGCAKAGPLIIAGAAALTAVAETSGEAIELLRQDECGDIRARVKALEDAQRRSP